MFISYNGVKCSCKIYNKGRGKPCLLLHGWACDGKIFESLIKAFPERTFITIDFPPFGKSEQTPEGWNIFTYANMVTRICEHLKISNCDILGHSFGGRVAIVLATLNKPLVNSLVLVDSAGLKPKRSFKYYIKVLNHKFLKKLGIARPNAGSEDYRKLSPEMKKVFINVVNQNLEEYCPSITAPTLIIFGKNDRDTPVYMARRLNKLIKHSKLIVLEYAGHFCFLDSPMRFYKHLQEFWEET